MEWSLRSKDSNVYGRLTLLEFHDKRMLLMCFSIIFHTVDWKKSCTSWYVVYPIIYRVWYISGGAGVQPSTVCFMFLPLSISKWQMTTSFPCSLNPSAPGSRWPLHRRWLCGRAPFKRSWRLKNVPGVSFGWNASCKYWKMCCCW